MSTTRQLDELATALGIRASELAALGEHIEPQQIAALRDGFLKAQTRERAELQQAIDGALKHVPALLRGAVLKILRG